MDKVPVETRHHRVPDARARQPPLPNSRSSRVIIVNEWIRLELTWMYYAITGNGKQLSRSN